MNYVIAKGNMHRLFSSDELELARKKSCIEGRFTKTNIYQGLINGKEEGIFISNDGEKYLVFSDYSVKKFDKITEKITLCFFGSANNTTYPSKIVSVKQYKKICLDKKESLRDLAFIMVGSHRNVVGFEVSSMKKLGRYDF